MSMFRPVTAATYGCRGLYVLRQQDQQGLAMFDAGRDQLYRRHAGSDQVGAVRAAGLAPLAGSEFVVHASDPDGSTQFIRVPVEVITVGTSQAILFSHGDYWHLWSRRGTRDFAEIFAQVVARVRPRSVYLPDLSRLIRSSESAQRVVDVLEKHVARVLVGDQEFRMVGAQARLDQSSLRAVVDTAATESNCFWERLRAVRPSHATPAAATSGPEVQ